MVLTHNEAVVLETLRHLGRGGAPIAVGGLKARVFRIYGIRYDAVDYALGRLMKNGAVERVSRGFYRATKN